MPLNPSKPRFKSNRRAVVRRFQKTLRRELDQSGEEMLDDMKRRMQQTKSGVHWPGMSLPSSAPGEAPAVQTKKLINSLESAQSEGQGEILQHIGTNARESGFQYPMHLETKANRWFMRPAFEKIVPIFVERLRKLGIGRPRKRR